MDFLSSPELASQLAALGQVLMIDLVLAGDNAVAVGLAAAALAPEQRKKAILIALAAAVVLRIGFALITVQLLAIVGLLLAGGLLLLWVCWEVWRTSRRGSRPSWIAWRVSEKAPVITAWLAMMVASVAMITSGRINAGGASL